MSQTKESNPILCACGACSEDLYDEQYIGFVIYPEPLVTLEIDRPPVSGPSSMLVEWSGFDQRRNGRPSDRKRVRRGRPGDDLRCRRSIAQR